jgi:16S rRNA (uracil1498-N3)-methyltransferase
MAERRFFTFPENVDLKKGFLTLPEDEAHHAVKVLRLKAGDRIEVIDGKRVYIAEVKSADKKKVTASILGYEVSDEKYPKLVLCQGFVKGKKADFIVEKATELGADEIVFFPTEHSVGVFDEKKQERLLKIAREASKQSRRVNIPDVKVLRSFFVPQMKSGEIGILFDPRAERNIKDGMEKPSEVETVYIFVGPEGGFSSDEVRMLEESSITAYRIDVPVLRTETASIVALAVVSVLF